MKNIFLRLTAESAPFKLQFKAQSQVVMTIRREIASCDHSCIFIKGTGIKIVLPFFKEKKVVLKDLAAGMYEMVDGTTRILGVICVDAQTGTQDGS